MGERPTHNVVLMVAEINPHGANKKYRIDPALAVANDDSVLGGQQGILDVPRLFLYLTCQIPHPRAPFHRACFMHAVVCPNHLKVCGCPILSPSPPQALRDTAGRANNEVNEHPLDVVRGCGFPFIFF